jgi:hypothetical protein
LVEGDFVLVKLAGKRSIFCYVAELMNNSDGKWKIYISEFPVMPLKKLLLVM